MDAAADLSVRGPTLLDPRVLVLVPVRDRAAMASLWRLEARLFELVAHHREPMLAQIKLAWWRERLSQIAAHSRDLPRGEPLLADLAAHWAGNGALPCIAQAYEAILLADSDDGRAAVPDGLAEAMRQVMGGASDAGRAWAHARTGQMAQERGTAMAVWQRACTVGIAAGEGGAEIDVAWRALDRWGALVARTDGRPSRRSVAWLLFRAGCGW